MHKHLFSLAVVLLSLLPALAQAQDSVPWAADLDSARVAAARQNRLVLIHFSTQHCPPCRNLEQTVFSQPYFGQAVSENFVPVKIDADAHPELATQYDITSVPTDVIITPEGQVRHRMNCPQDAQQYLTILQQVAQASAVGTQQAAIGGLYQGAQQNVAGASWSLPGSSAPPESSAPANSGGAWQSPHESVAQATPQGAYASQYQPAASQGGYAPAAQPAQGYASPGYGQQVSQTQTPQAQTPPATGYGAPAASGYGAPPSGSQPTTPAYGEQGQPASGGSGYGAPTGPTTPPSSGGGWGGSMQPPPAGPMAAQPSVPPQQGVAAQPGMAAPPAGGQQATNGNPPVGLEGFCPVTLMEQKQWTPGDPRWGAIHRGRTYLFASAEHQQRFLARPDDYAPMLSGNDPVAFVDRGQLTDGKRAHGVFYGQQMYLFSDEQNLQTFWSSPDRYVATVIEAMRRTPGAQR